MLVDCGLPGNGPRIVAFLESHGFAPPALLTVVLTHADPDHAGSAAELRALTGARIAIHADDAPVLAGGLTPARAKGPWRRRSALARLARLGHEVGMWVLQRFQPGRWRPARADLLLADGETIAGLRVVHAPGHTAGSIALRAPDGAVFTGDAVFGDAAGRAHYPPRALALDPDAAREAAHRLVASPFTVLYPGHGEPVRRAESGRGGSSTS